MPKGKRSMTIPVGEITAEGFRRIRKKAELSSAEAFKLSVGIAEIILENFITGGKIVIPIPKGMAIIVAGYYFPEAK